MLFPFVCLISTSYHGQMWAHLPWLNLNTLLYPPRLTLLTSVLPLLGAVGRGILVDTFLHASQKTNSLSSDDIHLLFRSLQSLPKIYCVWKHASTSRLCELDTKRPIDSLAVGTVELGRRGLGFVERLNELPFISRMEEGRDRLSRS